jgi:hypothetical protein
VNHTILLAKNIAEDFHYLVSNSNIEQSAAAATATSKEEQQQQKEINDFISHYKKMLLPLEFFVQMANSGVDTGISVIIDMKCETVSGDLVSFQE